jgi:hypothetical protein
MGCLPTNVAARVATPTDATSAEAAVAATPRPAIDDRVVFLIAEAHVALWLADASAKGVAAALGHLAAVLRRRWLPGGRSAEV